MVIIGVDAGATWVKAARFSETLEMLFETKIPSGAAQGVTQYFDSVVTAIKQCGGEPDAIGLSLPVTFTKDYTRIKYAGNITGLGVGSVGADWLAEIGHRMAVKKIVAENDAKCAALGEWALGEGGGNKSKSLLHVTWGTGIGTGFIHGGVPMYGWEGGHLPVVCDECVANPQKYLPLQCNCGSYKDLEARIAAPRLVKITYDMFQQKKWQTKFTAEDFADSQKTPILLCQLSEEGDELARTVMHEAVAWLANSLHMMSVLVYPDIVTIGGAMMDRDYLLQELRAAVAVNSEGYLGDSLKPEMVFRARLGNKAGVVGAAILARG